MDKIVSSKHVFIAYLLLVSFQLNSQSLDQIILHRKQITDSLVLLKNERNIIPIADLSLKIACLSIGVDSITNFQKRISDYCKVDYFIEEKTVTESNFIDLKRQISNYDLVICSLHGLNSSGQLGYGITKQMGEMVSFLADSLKSVVVLFGNKNSINELKDIEKADALLLANEESIDAHDLAAQLILGGIGTKSKLSSSINEHFKQGDGFETKGGIRFQYCLPEELGLNSGFINSKVDSITERAIKEGAFPGCQVIAAKDGKLFFHKTYGFQTFDSITPVCESNLYDFASITKITSALPALMKLYDDGKLKLDVPFSTYWPDFKHSDKKEIMVRDVLAHQARLKAWIPFWNATKKKDGHFKSRFIRSDSSKNFPVKITDGLYLHKNYERKIYKSIRKSKLLENKEYVYSDLSFYLYPQIIENITGIDFKTYLKQNFYNKIGAYTLGFNPLTKFSKQQIIPTENDTFFRMEQIQGTVHDEGAALMGGVSAHAGLFGTAIDLAKMVQMYLNMGKYGGQQFISDTTMKQFTKCQFPENNNRRGLGFDKPLLQKKKDGSCAFDASDASFGHSGFTGTFCWADPENGLLYILMTNRVYPTRNNSKISQLNIRPSIHQVFYDAIKNSSIGY